MTDYEADAFCDMCETDTVNRVTVWGNGAIEFHCLECGYTTLTDGDAIWTDVAR